MARAPASPPPFAGEGQGEGTQYERAFSITLSPTLPRKRGREQTEPVAHTESSYINSSATQKAANLHFVVDNEDHGIFFTHRDRPRVGSRERRHSPTGWTMARAKASPPPLAGEGQGEGMQYERAFSITLSPTLPRKRGREQTEPVARTESSYINSSATQKAANLHFVVDNEDNGIFFTHRDRPRVRSRVWQRAGESTRWCLDRRPRLRPRACRRWRPRRPLRSKGQAPSPRSTPRSRTESTTSWPLRLAATVIGEPGGEYFAALSTSCPNACSTSTGST